MRKWFTCYLCGCFSLLLTATTALGQTARVTGVVTDARTGETLVGVSVLVKGTNTGAQTGVNGDYTINVASNGTLVFSYIGYTPREVPVNNQTTVNISLQGTSTQLQQVVVVGYGTQRRRDVTGAVSRVEGEDIARQPVQTPTQALQGRTPGVQIIGSGQPNAQPQVRIRGVGSVLAGAGPLYVVDGVLTDDIRNINNADILSIDVLKDASAAIYGVRAANGVIIVTTRKGRKGPPKVSYDNNFGFNRANNLIEMANRTQYMAYLNDAAPGKAAADQQPLTYPGSTNWFDAITRSAFQMSHNLSLSGGSESNTYFVSTNYSNFGGIIPNNDFKRFTLRTNLDFQLNKKVKTGVQFSYTRSNERIVPLGGTITNAYRAAPVIIPKDKNGKYGNTSAWGNVGNPLLTLDKTNDQLLTSRLQGNAYIDYKPVEAVTLHTAFNTDLRNTHQRTYNYRFFNDVNTFTAAGGGQYINNSVLRIGDTQPVNWVWDNTITYNKTFGPHTLTVLAGATTEQYTTYDLTASRINVPEDPDQWYLNQGDPETQSTLSNGGDKYRRQSVLGRVNYSLSGKYLLNASFRADGSSRFQTKWGYFPTVGLGWVISEEGFLKDSKTISHLKLRGSWGRLGNDNIGSNQFIITATNNIPYFFAPAGQSVTNISQGAVIQDIKNTNLKWETTDQFDIGLEYGFFDNKLTGELDYYNKRVSNALTYVSIPAILGDPDNRFVTNAASYRNRGVEFSVKWQDKVNDDLTYNIGGNISYNQNRVIGLNGGQALLAGGVGQQSFTTRTDNNQPVAAFYLLKATGVFQNQAEVDAAPVNTFGEANRIGGLRYEDVSGPNGAPDGRIDANDRIYAGSYQPKFYGGLNLGISYKEFDLNADFYGNWGNKVYNGRKAFRYENTDNIQADYANARWTTANPSQTDPRVLTPSTPASTYFLESGNFIRLNNLTLGYTLNQQITKKIGITRLRVFATAQNLFTVKSYSGFTPEILNGDVLSSGVDLDTYPTIRTLIMGLNVQF